ncbi:MAG: UDP-3-O-(3-hydroxymyristoyl)glucosamine N-acyltransferase [Phaeodactylibacter sp.]|uniref:UDP-3-O-(3-hydroxymyristoyl)glucosamine N-acyltransferase n=1 Tax=Phaeodactylibacter sp. TaxID=1940289 RepID=UPI0032F04C8A
MQITARELAHFLGGTLEGNPDITVSQPSKIEEGGEGTISFLGNPKYESYAYTTTASVLLVSKDFEPKSPVSATLIRVDDVYASIARLLQQFGQQAKPAPGISDTAVISDEAMLGNQVSIGAAAIIEAGAQVGEGAIIMGQAYIGKGAKIGPNTLIYPGARILDRCEVGRNCIIHANAVIGSDGFGFAPKEDRSYDKIVHVGNVVIEDEVEIGANTTIDRATMGSTIIREGVKLDNLIQVGHNVEIGAHTVIAAQSGIAGSTKIGKYCRIGGQVGFAGHVEIADGSQIQAQSGIAGHIKEPNQAWFGSPIMPYRDFIRSHSVFKKLPELYKTISRLERELESLKPPKADQ